MTVSVEKKFGFRVTKNEEGKEIPAPEPIIRKDVQLLDVTDVVRLLQSGDQKVIDAVIDSLNSVVLGYYRDLIETIGIDEVRANGIPAEKYSFELIANLPARSKTVFEDAVWEEFKKDYLGVMVPAAGLTPDKAKVGGEILAGRLNKVRGNLVALNQFADRIKTWYANSSKQEEMLPVYQYLIGRCEDFIAANQPEAVLASF